MKIYSGPGFIRLAGISDMSMRIYSSAASFPQCLSNTLCSFPSFISVLFKLDDSFTQY